MADDSVWPWPRARATPCSPPEQAGIERYQLLLKVKASVQWRSYEWNSKFYRRLCSCTVMSSIRYITTVFHSQKCTGNFFSSWLAYWLFATFAFAG